MKLLTNIQLLFILLTFSIKLNAQDQLIDSLKNALKNAKHDTTRCNILEELIDSENNDNVWPVYNKQLLKLAEKGALKASHDTTQKVFYLKHLAGALNNIGFLAQNQGDVPKALEYYLKSLKIEEEIKNKKGIASSLNNVGSIYKDQGDISKGLEYYHKSLKMREEIKDKKGIASALNNIGIIHKNQGDAQKGLEYYHRSLKIQEEIKDKHGIAASLNNIGFIYDNHGDPSCHSSKKICIRAAQDKALEYYFRSLKIREEIKDKSGIAQSFNNIGGVFSKWVEAEQNPDSSLKRAQLINKTLEYYQKSLKIQEEIKDKSGIASSLNNIGSILLKQGKIIEALALANRSLQTSKELGYPKNIMSAASVLKNIYQKQNKFKEALAMYELEILMRDSISNETTKKASIKKQFQYQYEKQAAADSVKNVEEQKVKNALLSAQQAEIKQEKTKSYALYGGLALVLVFAGFMVNRFRVTHKQKQIIELKEIETQKQNEIITLQKHLVEEKHKEITDSINYAERIQRSFLATTELLDINLNPSLYNGEGSERDYFVLFQPKDVVSGDFYWASQLSNGNFALAIADSTGHGVPGAIMSILNISCLEKSVEQEKLTEPADILNHTRTKIIERLKKDGSEEGGKDGMDCSFICFDLVNSKLTYAAANNPVWIVRTVNSDMSVRAESRTENKFELIELAPDKMPVGKHDKDTIPFTQHSIDLQKGDVVYSLTDGIPDQFGGPKGKKFMYKQLKELLIGIAHLPMPKQKEILHTSLNNWKGDLEQVDDVCVIGIRV